MKPGLFESADGGTVFLDEIAEMNLQVQAELLRVLEERQVQRLGALKPPAIDVRFVAASHRDLEDEVAAGTFREDLFYRLNGITLDITSLRERKDEIEGLALKFITIVAAAQGKKEPMLSREALKVMHGHAWPGNTRELMNAIERAVALVGTGPTILPSQVAFTASRRQEVERGPRVPIVGGLPCNRRHHRR